MQTVSDIPLQRVRWNLLLSAELLRVLDILERHHIPAVPFKGPALATALYGDPALRESCDLDLLVRKQDIRRVPAILAAEGYSTDLPQDPRGQDAYIRTRYELHFTSPAHNIPIEIHQSFVPPSYCLGLDYDALWRRLETTDFFGREILALSPADLLLMLSIHGAKHQWQQVTNIQDIAGLLHKWCGAFVWPDVAYCGGERLLRVAVLLASQVLGASVPPAILRDCLQDRTAVKLANEAQAALSAESRQDSFLRSHLWFLRSRERLRDRIAAFLSLAWAPTEKDYKLVELPDFLSPLYFPLHALRMVFKILTCSSTSF